MSIPLPNIPDTAHPLYHVRTGTAPTTAIILVLVIALLIVVTESSSVVQTGRQHYTTHYQYSAYRTAFTDQITYIPVVLIPQYFIEYGKQHRYHTAAVFSIPL